MNGGGEERVGRKVEGVRRKKERGKRMRKTKDRIRIDGRERWRRKKK